MAIIYDLVFVETGCTIPIPLPLRTIATPTPRWAVVESEDEVRSMVNSRDSKQTTTQLETGKRNTGNLKIEWERII
jgi:hypothetical protein